MRERDPVDRVGSQGSGGGLQVTPQNLVYLNYWKRKQLSGLTPPIFSLYSQVAASWQFRRIIPTPPAAHWHRICPIATPTTPVTRGRRRRLGFRII